MLTYSFEERGSHSLYEYLYLKIKEDILNYALAPNEKLPSKRALAKHLNISTITVENAYNQLVAEGYLYTKPKSGFYVSDISPKKNEQIVVQNKFETKNENSASYLVDFVSNSTVSEAFPFATWAKLMREIMSDYEKKLMVSSPSAGVPELRTAIANYLHAFRGMLVKPEQIIIGAGTEYLYGLIIQLFGQNKTYAVEDPGYQKISRIYKANRVSCVHIPMDENGISVQALEQTDANILHISPSHHFPTGIVTPISRRYELLSWASKAPERYIIEDDYDSEFRLLGKPIPSLQSIDVLDKVIYMNTFSKSLASTIRISYMVLPQSLLPIYQEQLGFYSCTVSNFEQYTLARFIEKGYLEKHINRMRNFYRTQRDTLLSCIRNYCKDAKVQIKEEHAGLHFLLEVETKHSDLELIEQAAKHGVRISCLSQYFHYPEQGAPHTLVINYSGIDIMNIKEAVEKLFHCFE